MLDYISSCVEHGLHKWDKEGRWRGSCAKYECLNYGNSNEVWAEGESWRLMKELKSKANNWIWEDRERCCRWLIGAWYLPCFVMMDPERKASSGDSCHWGFTGE